MPDGNFIEEHNINKQIKNFGVGKKKVEWAGMKIKEFILYTSSLITKCKSCSGNATRIQWIV